MALSGGRIGDRGEKEIPVYSRNVMRGQCLSEWSSLSPLSSVNLGEVICRNRGSSRAAHGGQDFRSGMQCEGLSQSRICKRLSLPPVRLHHKCEDFLIMQAGVLWCDSDIKFMSVVPLPFNHTASKVSFHTLLQGKVGYYSLWL